MLSRHASALEAKRHRKHEPSHLCKTFIPTEPIPISVLTTSYNKSTPLVKNTDQHYTRSKRHHSKLAARALLATTAPKKLPSAWIWKCHKCHEVHHMGATRKCLGCEHILCFAKAGRGGRVCDTKFDWAGWKKYNIWRRKTYLIPEKNEMLRVGRHGLEVVEKKDWDCTIDCDYPSQCKWDRDHSSWETCDGDSDGASSSAWQNIGFSLYNSPDDASSTASIPDSWVPDAAGFAPISPPSTIVSVDAENDTSDDPWQNANDSGENQSFEQVAIGLGIFEDPRREWEEESDELDSDEDKQTSGSSSSVEDWLDAVEHQTPTDAEKGEVSIDPRLTEC